MAECRTIRKGHHKVVLKSASQFLHIATNGRVYFKKFIIEFPKSWPRRKDARILGATYYPKSEVRIRNSSFCGDARPYTVSSGGCGEKGDFMHLPAEYLLNLSPLTAEKKESSAYTFVHEWAHLRYGVFDEYGRRGDPEYPETYCEGRKISHFCESGQGLRMHNYEARTTQNVMCKRKSASDVILSNDDFKKLAAPNLSKRIHVTFEEAQRGDQPQKVVVALDTSSSMKVISVNVQVLNKPNDPPHGSIVMLVTDGAENAKPYLRSMIPSLVNSLVEVSTFALGTAADPKLEELAAATNGRVFYFPNSQKFAAVRMEVALQTASTPGMVDSAWPIMRDMKPLLVQCVWT
ncbi:hypothetical protein HPB49_010147 [Dermacentor silvarum]|uniref:Uncharacterized protein n=1 Tax=Dermacentor silvarum TaxID=543639 RepID=A0ACB8DN78_DERSI|nr:hypothetical protein HPB49_010147 [Dermacentor silvarum]